MRATTERRRRKAAKVLAEVMAKNGKLQRVVNFERATTANGFER